MRMNKQAKAAGTLKEYLGLLSRYQEQGVQGEEEEWTSKEIAWANQLLDNNQQIIKSFSPQITRIYTDIYVDNLICVNPCNLW